MKKTYKIGVASLVCSIMIILLTLSKNAFGDKTVLTHIVDESCTARVRAEGIWEYSIPVYLEIIRKGKQTLESASFYAYYPKEIESKELGLEIHIVDHILFVYHQEDPNEILALVDLQENLIHPGKAGDNYEAIKLYHAKVRDLFARLKVLLKKDDIELSRYPQELSEN